MGSLIKYTKAQSGPATWDASASESLHPGLELVLDGGEKVVFITVNGRREVSKVCAGYFPATAKLAVLDVSEWALHILAPQFDGTPVEPIFCGSWVAAAEAAIAHLGPVNVWMDTRGAMFPPVSRVGKSR